MTDATLDLDAARHATHSRDPVELLLEVRDALHYCEAAEPASSAAQAEVGDACRSGRPSNN